MPIDDLDPRFDPVVPGLLSVPDTKIYSWEHPRDLVPIQWDKAVKVRPNEAMIYGQQIATGSAGHESQSALSATGR